MSKSTLALSFAAAAAVALATILPTHAATPTAMPGDPLNFVGVGYDYSDWSLSVYYSGFTKNYKHKNILNEMDFSRISTAIGCSLDSREFITLYGVIGLLEHKKSWINSSENASLFGLGLWMNLWETDQLPIFEGVDAYSVTAGIEGVYSRADFGGFYSTYASIDGFLFFEIHGESYKRAFIFPRSYGIYVGPVFSYSVSNDYDTDDNNIVGLGGGLNIRFTENINLKIGGDYYSDDSSVYAQFSINF